VNGQAAQRQHLFVPAQRHRRLQLADQVPHHGFLLLRIQSAGHGRHANELRWMLEQRRGYTRQISTTLFIRCSAK